MIGGAPFAMALIGLIVLIALVAIVILPARTERSDVTGQKIYAKFLLAVVFLFTFAGIFSAYGVAYSLSGLIGSHSCPAPTGLGAMLPSPLQQPLSSLAPQIFGSQSHSAACTTPAGAAVFPGISGNGTPGDRAARGTAFYGLVLLFSAVVVWINGHAAGRLFSSDEARRGPPGRVLDAYLFSTGFVAVVVLVLATVGALYGLFAVMGPGTFGAVGRGRAAQQLISGGLLAVLADGVLWWHLRQAWKIHAPRPSVAGTGASSDDPGSSGPGPVSP